MLISIMKLTVAMKLFHSKYVFTNKPKCNAEHYYFFELLMLS